MFMEGIISDSHSIFKFLKGLDLDLFLSKPQFKHLHYFLNQMIDETYDGKFSAVKHCHRTTFGRFLNHSPWDDELIANHIQSYLLSCIYNFKNVVGTTLSSIINPFMVTNLLP